MRKYNNRYCGVSLYLPGKAEGTPKESLLVMFQRILSNMKSETIEKQLFVRVRKNNYEIEKERKNNDADYI